MNPFLTAIIIEVLGKVALRYLFKSDPDTERERDQARADLIEAKETAEALLAELEDVMAERDELLAKVARLEARINNSFNGFYPVWGNG